MICIDDDLCSPQLGLLLPIHYVILMNAILMSRRSGAIVLIRLTIWVQIINLITCHVLHYFSLHLSESFLILLLLSLRWTRYFKALCVLLLIKLIHLILVLRSISSSLLLVPTLIVHLELEILLL